MIPYILWQPWACFFLQDCFAIPFVPTKCMQMHRQFQHQRHHHYNHWALAGNGMKISFLLIGRGLFLRLIKHCSIHRCTLGGKRRFGIWKFDLMSATPEVGAIPKRRRNLFLNNLLRNPILTILVLCQTLKGTKLIIVFIEENMMGTPRETDVRLLGLRLWSQVYFTYF